ncbi:chaperone protein DnaJ-like [Lolium rigidum]|uniref:chaperone protein DnaJ-like n=1 Tax=Lolium rigidum TaxID=89674 RepID=UPI001F5DBA53|nr:chaperone protein DnaJ-like [Lolium rigidum]
MQSQPQYRSSYYAVLGVHPRASAAEIRAAYHRLAMRWHPDKIANGRADPARAEEAKARFQQIHEAYKVLSDEKRRALYDAGMYDPLNDDQEEVEGFHDFLQEMLSLMATVGREEPVYSLGELQCMLNGMMQDFSSPQPPPPPSSFFTSTAPSTRSSGGQQQRRSSSSVLPQGFSSSACFTRTAFSGC